MNKGFTLVELLATLVILGLVLGISIPTVLTLIEDSRMKAYEENERKLVDVAKVYFHSRPDQLSYRVGDVAFITLAELIQTGRIEEVIDAKDNQPCDKYSSGVAITKVDRDIFSYEPYLSCSNYTSTHEPHTALAGIKLVYNEGLSTYQVEVDIDKTSDLHEISLPSGSTYRLLQSTAVDYLSWELNTSGNQPGWYDNGSASENAIILKENPWQETDIVWATESNDIDSGGDGGWVTPALPIEPTQKYRYTVWIRRENVLNSGAGTTYTGVYGYKGTETNVGVEKFDGTRNTNPYPQYYGDSHWRGSGYNFPQDEWLLFVNYIYPAGSNSDVYDNTAGVYGLDGTQYRSGQNQYRWASDNDHARIRSYLYYSTQTDERQYWYRPRFEVVDGTEPTIEELLKGYENPNAYGATQISDGSDLIESVTVNNEYQFNVKYMNKDKRTIRYFVGNLE